MSDRCPRCGEVPNPDGQCACPKQQAASSLAAPTGSADRVIIGESLQAGWPISAKVYQPDGKGDFGMPPMRWAKRADSTFALECYVFGHSQWVEVPLWETPPNSEVGHTTQETKEPK